MASVASVQLLALFMLASVLGQHKTSASVAMETEVDGDLLRTSNKPNQSTSSRTGGAEPLSVAESRASAAPEAETALPTAPIYRSAPKQISDLKYVSPTTSAGGGGGGGDLLRRANLGSQTTSGGAARGANSDDLRNEASYKHKKHKKIYVHKKKKPKKKKKKVKMIVVKKKKKKPKKKKKVKYIKVHKKKKKKKKKHIHVHYKKKHSHVQPTYLKKAESHRHNFGGYGAGGGHMPAGGHFFE